MTSTTSRRITILKPVPCPVCANQRVTWAWKPFGWVAVQVACFACCGDVPVGVPGRSGR